MAHYSSKHSAEISQLQGFLIRSVSQKPQASEKKSAQNISLIDCSQVVLERSLSSLVIALLTSLWKFGNGFSELRGEVRSWITLCLVKTFGIFSCVERSCQD